MIDSALLMAYEVRLRPEGKQWPEWLDAPWAKIARTLDALEERPSGHAEPLDMGQIALACALGYLDFRHGVRSWREGRPRLTAWAARMAERPSLATTRPG